jgi:hypothetical protein
MTAPIVVPTTLEPAGPPALRPFAEQGLVAFVDQYDLAAVDWSERRALIVTMHADQRLLQRLSAEWERLLDRGGVILFNGHIAHPFLPTLSKFVKIVKPRLDQFAVVKLCDHPVYQGLPTALMNKRRGVAGFWGRGHNPPPDGAQILQALDHGHAPIDWIWRRKQGGTVFMHGGNDLWSNFEDAALNAQIARQAIGWIVAEIHRESPAELVGA